MEDSRTVSVVMHTHERPHFVEQDVAAGLWDGIPLFIADDGSSGEIQTRLRALAEKCGAGYFARQENGGAARAAHDGVEASGSPYFMLCGDDDYLQEAPRFIRDAALVMSDPDVLMAVMPEVRFVRMDQPGPVQYDRRVFDGMTGRQLLRELVFGGEMRALQAGAIMRSAEALPLFASSLFRTSEDFVLIARLCAAYPERRVRVLDRGAYMRREHAGSLSHRTNMSSERAVANLLALLIGGRLLQRIDRLEEGILLGLLRQRAQVISTVYGAGNHSMAVLDALLNGAPPDTSSQEAREAIRFLKENTDLLPAELGRLRSCVLDLSTPGSSETPQEFVDRAGALVEHGDLEAAEDLLQDFEPPDPETRGALYRVRARIAMKRNDAEATVDLLGRALVANPEDPESLHLLAQIAGAGGDEETQRRLTNRLVGLLSPEQSGELGISQDPAVGDLKVAFIVSEGLDQFLDDIIRMLLPYMNARKFVVRTKTDISDALEWADVSWFEWCNDPIVWASRQDIVRRKGVICRLHRYEAFSDMPLKVQWDQVDALVVVAEHLAGIVSDQVSGLKQRTLIRHIPNGVDLNRFRLLDREHGFDIALIGYLHGRKNPGMALQILRRLVDSDRRYRLHVAGKFQDPVLKLYWNHMVLKLGLSDNVVMYEWQSDIAKFLEDKQYLLSTSQHESFGYSIAEAMARGIMPVVHNFPFAEDMWAQEMLFTSIDEAVEIIQSGEYDSSAYRKFISDHYTLQDQVAQIKELIEQVALDVSGQGEVFSVNHVLHAFPRMVNLSLVVRCPRCHEELVLQQQTIAGHPVARERCPACSAAIRLDDNAYRAALENCRNGLREYDAYDITRTLRNIAMNWSSHTAWKDVMTVDGLDLGHCMEFEVTPYLIQAWLRGALEREQA